MIPTPEQDEIISAARDTSDNLLISALAGSAKTTTLILIAKALPSIMTLCLAFNKKVADEMKERLPGNCEAMTLNSLGHRAWAKAINVPRLTVNTKKNYDLLSSFVKDLTSKRDKDEVFENFADILKMIEQGKSAGYVPNGIANATGLMNDEEFFASLDEEPSVLVEQLIRGVSAASITQGFKGLIDFSDQILLPTIFPCSFPAYPLILIDESQDLSELNHATLAKLVRKRLIAVGDECQAIYAFRGAHQHSMALMRERFAMRQLTLSVSFRCPQTVVEAARWRAPHMKYPEWAKAGSVETLTKWSINDIPSDQPVTILCRNNAPIFSMAIKLLKAGRYSEVVGNDVGKALSKIMKKFGKPDMEQKLVLEAIGDWKNEKLKKSRSAGRVHDQAECMTIFAAQGKNLGEALAYIDFIMQTKGPITLMTGHKAKGLEFDTVFILDQDLLHMDKEQDRNLLYVMQTRTKDRLVYVDSNLFTEV